MAPFHFCKSDGFEVLEKSPFQWTFLWFSSFPLQNFYLEETILIHVLNTIYILISLCQTLPWYYHFYFLWLPKDSMAVVLLGKSDCETEIFRPPRQPVSLMQAAHDLGQSGFPQLRQQRAVSLQRFLGNKPLGPEGEMWVAQHSIHHWHVAGAFKITSFGTSVTSSMTSLSPHPRASLGILYLLVAFHRCFSIPVNNLVLFLTF